MIIMDTIGFVDEFGNNSFDFKTQGSHFIVSCVLVKGIEKVTELEEKLEIIRKKYFQKGEIKSSKVASNHGRRKLILDEIKELDFSIFAVVIDKRELQTKGFQYKKSFYKFINNLLYQELFKTFNNITLNVDEHGSNKFMLEFKNYVSKKHPRTLFGGIEFKHQNSHNSIIIQLADFISGSLGYVYDETKKSDESENFKNLLEPKITYIEHFPRIFVFNDFKRDTPDNVSDDRVLEVCFLRVQDFLEKNENNSDEIVQEQCKLLNLLLLLQKTNTINSYISTKELMKHVNAIRDKPMNEEYFRSKIIGNLRDRGVIIASSSRGYKIPTSLEDIQSFIKHGNRVIMPMLNRIREANNAIKLATGNETDVLKDYEGLKKIIKTIE